jgi:hypothetical protein
MTAPSKLFLDRNSFDGKWKVLDSKEFAYGSGETPEDAIRSARVVSDATIYANSNFTGIIDEVLDIPVRDVSELTSEDEIYSIDELVECMADLGGFNVRKVYKDNFFLGYTFEVME